MDPQQAATVSGGGIMGRFENVKTTRSCKKMIPCDASTSEYHRNDFLKPQHLPIDRCDAELNFATGPNLQETRFHKGFHRRHQADIQQDAARLEAELIRDMTREERAQATINATRAFKERHTFNILTGEGVGRENEFRQVGKKVLNPTGTMSAIFGEHERAAANRMKASKHRFFEPDVPQKESRAATIFNEGLTHTTREAAIIGYGRCGKSRTRSQSVGAYDNYAHTRHVPEPQPYEPPHHGNRSQIILG